MATSRSETNRPLPHPSPLTQPFWDATKEGKLKLQRCTRCGEYVWTPQMICRHCLADALEWTEVSGEGEVYSFVVMHRAAIEAFEAPYTIAVITLKEGPRILSDVIGIDPSEVKIGMPVKVDFEDAGPVGLYHFRPAN